MKVLETPVGYLQRHKEVPLDVIQAVEKAWRLVVGDVSQRSGVAGRLEGGPVFASKIDLRVEEDPEVPGWKYGVITVEVPASTRSLKHITGERKILDKAVIKEVYSQLTPDEATKVLVVFRYVQSE